MDDLISREEAIEHLKHRLYETQFNNDTEYPYYEEIADNRIDVWMDEVPSVQPEQKHGRWIITEDMPCFGYIQEYLTCSVCDAKYNGTGVSAEWNYCPNCGAKMETKGE